MHWLRREFRHCESRQIMASNWDEIKRLAADFQKAQLTSTLQKLSERNCIEIVTLLLDKQLLEVVFTNDGKEYITPEHLEREIQDELYTNGGRVNLVEVSKTLNVDLTKIESIAERIAATDKSVHFMLGQLLNEDYIVRIAQEINEKLSLKGELSMSHLAEFFDLPTDFLQRHVVEQHLGKIIRGRQDSANPRILFTQAYIQRCKAKIRGALAAITRPTNVATILQSIQVQEKIFHSLLDEISPAGHVTSKLPTAQYVPHIYAKMQSDWVNSFYKQNGFLEYSAITKLGISDPKQFIRKQIPSDELMFLKRCAIGSKIVDLTVIASLNECAATKSFIDLSTILPSNMSDEDIEEVFNTVTMSQKINTPANHFVYMDGIVFSQSYLTDMIQPCYELALSKGQGAIESGIYQHYVAECKMAHKPVVSGGGHDVDEGDSKRDERRKKAATGKAGGGSQGRETKTKSTKKHQRGGRGGNQADSDNDDDNNSGKRTAKSLELVPVDEVARIVNAKLAEEGLDHLAAAIAQLYHSQLNNVAIGRAQELFETTPQTHRRQTHAAVQEKINSLLVDMRLYEKGLKVLPADLQSQLLKYLLKSLGNDICNELTFYIAAECNLQIKSSAGGLNVDQRNKVAQECDAEYKSALLELNKSMNKSIEEFLVATEAVLKACSMIIKKFDKKKERPLIEQHKQQLFEQLQSTSDPALLLHIITLLIFTVQNGCLLHASGKFVAQILAFLRPQLTGEQNQLLLQYHDSLLQMLSLDAASDDAKCLNEKLQGLQEQIKSLAKSLLTPKE